MFAGAWRIKFETPVFRDVYIDIKILLRDWFEKNQRSTIEVFNDERVKIHFTFEDVLADHAE